MTTTARSTSPDGARTPTALHWQEPPLPVPVGVDLAAVHTWARGRGVPLLDDEQPCATVVQAYRIAHGIPAQPVVR